jgi:hypothetical protein
VLQFLDDDQYKASSRAGKLFPKEKDEIPTLWPVVAGGIFVLAAIGLFVTTAYKNYMKRKDYQPVPTTTTTSTPPTTTTTGVSLVV